MIEVQLMWASFSYWSVKIPASSLNLPTKGETGPILMTLGQGGPVIPSGIGFPFGLPFMIHMGYGGTILYPGYHTGQSSYLTGFFFFLTIKPETYTFIILSSLRLRQLTLKINIGLNSSSILFYHHHHPNRY